MFEDDTEYKLRFRANGTIEVEQRTEDGTQLYELEENPLVDENWGDKGWMTASSSLTP